MSLFVTLINQSFRFCLSIQLGLLPCGHTYCTNCLQELCAGSDTIICPQCRKVYDVPSSGVGTFPRNVSCQQLLDIKTEQLVSTRQCQVIKSIHSNDLFIFVVSLERSVIKNVLSPIVFIVRNLSVLIVKKLIVMN